MKKLTLLFLFIIPHVSYSSFFDNAQIFCKRSWKSTQQATDSIINSITNPHQKDSRIFLLSTIGTVGAFLGLWIIKKGVDVASTKEAPLFRQQLQSTATSFQRGAALTSFGVLCTCVAVTLMVSSKPLVTYIDSSIDSSR